MTARAPVHPRAGDRILAGVRRRLSGPLLVVAVVALLHGVAWTILMPAYQTPDEPAHVAYVQHLAETGRLPPEPGRPAYSTEEQASFAALNTLGIIGRAQIKPPSTGAEATQAERALDRARRLPRGDGGGPSSASSQPPLYYGMASAAYLAGHGSSIATRVWLMRLLSVACFVGTALGAALLAGELLPGRPWAPVTAGLLVALQPMVASISAGVNPDALLFLVATLLLLVAARIVRRGLTRRRAIALGALVGAGVMTKLTFAPLVPAAALALAIGVWRRREELSRGDLARLSALAIGVAAVLPAIYVAWATAQGRGLVAAGVGAPPLPADQQTPLSLREFLSYAWQLYLPRFGFVNHQFGYWPPDETWLRGSIGRFGWLDYGLAPWIYRIAEGVAVATLGLCGVGLALHGRIRRHAALLAVYALAAAALALVIAWAGYTYRHSTGAYFEQARYLFPLVGLYALAIVTACAAVGRRAAPVLAAAFVGLAALHVVAAVLATATRYYG